MTTFDLRKKVNYMKLQSICW